jgi:hypothetical protein
MAVQGAAPGDVLVGFGASDEGGEHHPEEEPRQERHGERFHQPVHDEE